MQLCYRGVHYNHKPIEIKVGETSHEVTISKERDQKEIVYRGVALSESRQTKFLGRIYKKNYLAISIPKKPTKFLGQFSMEVL